MSMRRHDGEPRQGGRRRGSVLAEQTEAGEREERVWTFGGW